MAAKQKFRGRRVQEELVFYDVLVSDWDYYFSFSTSEGRELFDEGNYSEIHTVEFRGTITYPEGLKYPQCEVTFSGKPGLLDEKRDDLPKSVGFISAHNNQFHA